MCADFGTHLLEIVIQGLKQQLITPQASVVKHLSRWGNSQLERPGGVSQRLGEWDPRWPCGRDIGTGMW